MDGNLFDAFSLMIVRNQKYMNKLLGFASGETGLNTTSLLCLRIISHNENGISAAELCDKSCYDKALISRTFKELSEKGYIRRNSEDENVKRGYRMILTDKGKGITDYIENGLYLLVDELIKDISEEDLMLYYNMSLSFSNNLRRVAEELPTQSGKQKEGEEKCSS